MHHALHVTAQVAKKQHAAHVMAQGCQMMVHSLLQHAEPAAELVKK